VKKLCEHPDVKQAFGVLREPPPTSSGLIGTGLDLGRAGGGGLADVGQTVPTPADPRATFSGRTSTHWAARCTSC
jgi:hypothetical protein